MRPAFLCSPLFLVATVWCGSLSHSVQADEFGGGANAFSIEFVTIGDPGNPPDTTGDPNPAGSVPYAYRIGKYEISEQMIDKANALDSLGIVHDGRGPDKPATNITGQEASRFVNWLNTSTGHAPAYKFDGTGALLLWEPADAGYDPDNRFRNSQAKYFLPSNDEWYKAAYYDPLTTAWFNYPTGSNSPPTSVSAGTDAGTAVYLLSTATGPADVTQAGGLSPYGTIAQGGNASELTETEFDLVNDNPSAARIVRGGAWDGIELGLSTDFFSFHNPASTRDYIGFRVASVIPEPSAALLAATAMIALSRLRRQRAFRTPMITSE